MPKEIFSLFLFLIILSVIASASAKEYERWGESVGQATNMYPYPESSDTPEPFVKQEKSSESSSNQIILPSELLPINISILMKPKREGGYFKER